jgi:hypothetical protein
MRAQTLTASRSNAVATNFLPDHNRSQSVSVVPLSHKKEWDNRISGNFFFFPNPFPI